MSTTRSTTSSGPTVPAAYAGLVDDAAIFPPGDMAMSDALVAHAGHRDAWYADLVGPFICSDTRLPELQQVRHEIDAQEPLRIGLTITGGAGAIEPALTWVDRDPGLLLVAVEVAVREDVDTGHTAHNAARITTVLAGALGADVDAYLELPRLRSPDVPAGWAAALDEIAASGHRLKYRTGGPDVDAFPSAAELATVIDAAIEREVELKCTAGLHNAVAHRSGGLDHHGFLNVLLATRAALDSTDRSQITEVLDDRDPGSVAARVRTAGADGLGSARQWFRSFGSCSIIEPRDDLVGLGLMDGRTSTRREHGA